MSGAPEKLNVAVIQLTSTDVADENLARIEAAYREAVGQGADLALAPENSVYFRVRRDAAVEGISAAHLARLEKLVAGHHTGLMVTSAVADPGGKNRNATFLFEPGHAAREVYAKIHLFDVDVAGAPPVRESDQFVGGAGPRIVEFRGWKIGMSICYDLRFAELYLPYAQTADLIVVPSAFLVPTGEAHWHTLLRARAIEAQAFVAAPAQVGEHHSGDPGAADQVRRTYGHSLVVDPWGRVVGDLEGGPETRTFTLAREEINKVRRQIPMEKHRRLGRR